MAACAVGFFVALAAMLSAEMSVMLTDRGCVMMALAHSTSCGGLADPGRIARMSPINSTKGIQLMSHFLSRLALALAVLVPAHAFGVDPVGADHPQKLKAEEPAGIEGYWTVNGKESASGKPYSGIATIERKGEAYLVHWAMQGGSSFVGVGLRTGDSFSVAWALPRGDTVLRGLNVYKIDGKTMSGRWLTLPGNGQIQTETMSFLKSLEVMEVD